MGGTITDSDIDLKMKISRAKYLEKKKLIYLYSHLINGRVRYLTS